MARLVALVTALAAGGCFYTDAINDRPATELQRITPTSTPFRGQVVSVRTSTIDPNGDPVTVTWTATSCAPGGQACEALPFTNGVVDASTGHIFELTVPRTVTTRAVKIVAHTEDSFGASALLDAELVIDVANHLPEVELRYTEGPPGGPTTITASVTDADDALGAVTFTSWRVMAPPGGDTTPPFVKIGDNSGDPDRDSTDETYRLIPDVEGGWFVEVVVTDPLGASVTEMIEIPVGPDRPPCIADAFPVVPPPGASLIVDETRRFSVLVVSDDLDVFPAPPPGDPYRGEAEFSWSLRSPGSGGALVALTGAVGNFVEIDPLTYDPGDLLELRVEIADRIPRTLPCPPSQPSCAIEPTTSCLQRQSWAIEVR